jgi:hypothetical protein
VFFGLFDVFFNIDIGMQELQVQTSIKVKLSSFLISFRLSITITSVSFLGINTLLSTKKSKE